MAAYGSTAQFALVKRIGSGDQDELYTVYFTTAGSSAPTVDSAKTRGIVSIVRTSAGLFTITLPRKLRNCVVRADVAAYPASAILNAVVAAQTENTATATVTTPVISTGAAGDTTGYVIAVVIQGRPTK